MTHQIEKNRNKQAIAPNPWISSIDQAARIISPIQNRRFVYVVVLDFQIN